MRPSFWSYSRNSVENEIKKKTKTRKTKHDKSGNFYVKNEKQKKKKNRVHYVQNRIHFQMLYHLKHSLDFSIVGCD